MRTVIIDKPYIFLDLWSISHLISGFTIIIILSYYIDKLSKRWWYLLGLLVLWEAFEFILYGVIDPPIFVVDTKINTFTDLWVGLLGGLLAERYLNRHSKTKHLNKEIY